ncbi:MAG TPA: SET domain-containing protein-lysine N-methyltransferase [Xanthomonadales bacterium]|nr:SET domain-containing protein-lysine N-methyltransferase [Xanthomonadales bacterium]
MSRRFIVRNSPIHGRGVFALTDLEPGTDLVQYKGRLLTTAQADRLYENTSDTGHTFLFTLNDDYVVDANSNGNAARWINHSCNPNCVADTDEAPDGKPKNEKIMIRTRRRIRAGEELTYDYGIVLEEPHTTRMKRIWACRCGSRRCTGTMLKPKRNGKANGHSKGNGRA